MPKIALRRNLETCPYCKRDRPAREHRGPLLRLFPKAKKYRCYHCGAVTVRLFDLITIAF